jgi:hypothetical protein
MWVVVNDAMHTNHHRDDEPVDQALYIAFGTALGCKDRDEWLEQKANIGRTIKKGRRIGTPSARRRAAILEAAVAYVEDVADNCINVDELREGCIDVDMEPPASVETLDR